METPKLILLVEDNENDEMLGLRALKKAAVPNKVEVARDGIEAAAFLFDAAQPVPSLILLDLKLPRMNGIEVLQRVRTHERTRRIPVVVFTSSDEESDVLGCFDCGANSFVRKPLEFGEYMEKLAKLAEYWLSINQPCRSV